MRKLFCKFIYFIDLVFFHKLFILFATGITLTTLFILQLSINKLCFVRARDDSVSLSFLFKSTNASVRNNGFTNCVFYTEMAARKQRQLFEF